MKSFKRAFMDSSLKSIDDEDLLIDASFKSLKHEDVKRVMQNIQQEEDFRDLAEANEFDDLHRILKQSENFAPKAYSEKTWVEMPTDIFCQAPKLEPKSDAVPQSIKHGNENPDSCASGVVIYAGNYRDFANVPDEVAVGNTNQANARGPQEHFPLKLHKIIESSEMEGYSSIISWLSHGRAFKIHDIDQFTEKIMQKYFFQTKLASFQRQLKVYGFRKLSKSDKGAYYHELFLRGRRGLCPGIVRSKAVLSRGAEEPNLRDIPPLPSTPVKNHNQDIARLNNDLQPVRYIHSGPLHPSTYESGDQLYPYRRVVSNECLEQLG